MRPLPTSSAIRAGSSLPNLVPQIDPDLDSVIGEIAGFKDAVTCNCCRGSFKVYEVEPLQLPDDDDELRYRLVCHECFVHILEIARTNLEHVVRTNPRVRESFKEALAEILIWSENDAFYDERAEALRALDALDAESGD